MAIHNLVYIPDPRLRKTCAPITEFNSELHTLIDDMFETMYEARGVGLAANQIGLNKSIAVIDVTDDKSQQLVLVNPEVLETEGEEKMQEGCLSVPGYYETVYRAAKVKMRAQDKHGEFFEMETDGILGEAIQHEIDHLNGKVFIDLLSKLKRMRIESKMKKQQRL